MLYSYLRSALFRLDAEQAHYLAVNALHASLGTRPARELARTRMLVEDRALEVERFGIRFPNPVGEGKPAEIEVRQLYEMDDFKEVIEPATADRFNKIGME